MSLLSKNSHSCLQKVTSVSKKSLLFLSNVKMKKTLLFNYQKSLLSAKSRFSFTKLGVENFLFSLQDFELNGCNANW